MKDAFLIISVVDFPDMPLSYSSVRSTYSPAERLEQTKETVLSIKKYCSDALIYIIEAGSKDRSEDFNDVNYIYCGNERKIKDAVQNKYKALGERAAMIRGLEVILENKEIGHIFKLSGRYYLNEKFSRSNWHDGEYNFKEVGNVYSTRLYSFPFPKVKSFMTLLSLSLPLALAGLSFERILHILIPRRVVNNVDPLGVAGIVAVNGDIIEE